MKVAWGGVTPTVERSMYLAGVHMKTPKYSLLQTAENHNTYRPVYHLDTDSTDSLKIYINQQELHL